MKDIVDWLIKIEDLAFILYDKSADRFIEDKKFSDFLRKMAEDEAMHFHILGSAKAHLDKIEKKADFLAMDKNTISRIEDPFIKYLGIADENNYTMSDLIDCIVATETSEWNHLFLFVINSLKNYVPEFKIQAIKFQNHIKSILQFLETIEYGSEKLKSIKALKPVWNEKILIVDDEPAIVEFLQAVLSDKGVIDVAFNGKQGLEKLKNDYYRLIISDVDMPIVSGIDFFSMAIERFPTIKDRFLFFTGSLDHQRLSYFKDNEISYMTKPASIDEIQKHTRRILNLSIP